MKYLEIKPEKGQWYISRPSPTAAGRTPLSVCIVDGPFATRSIAQDRCLQRDDYQWCYVWEQET